MFKELYVSGEYLKKNPGWHIEESPWKAMQVLRMMEQNRLAPDIICEIGCGAGEILKQLQMHMAQTCEFWGYDISPQAIELSGGKANERLHFKLADIRQENTTFFDLILVMDVIEHLEDYFSFLREIRPKGSYKIFHIPLDLSVQTVLRSNALLKVRRSYGHIHYFTTETALQTIKDAGYEVLDHFYTARAIEVPSNVITRRLLQMPRRLLFAIHQDLTSRILGGLSLLVLTR